MVTNGKKQRLEQPTIAAVNFDGDRIPMPSRFNPYTGLSGEATVDCWLLVVTAGRYRLIAEESLAISLEKRLGRIDDGEEATGHTDALAETGANGIVALRNRIIPTTAHRMGTNWRVTIPKELKLLVPANEERSFVFLMVVAKFVEFWFPETLRRAFSLPLGENAL